MSTATILAVIQSSFGAEVRSEPWCPGPALSSSARLSLFPFRFLRHHDRPGTVPGDTQVGAAGQTVAVFRHRAEDAQADAADKADGDDVAVAEASGAEVDIDTCRENQMGGARRGRREEGCQEVG